MGANSNPDQEEAVKSTVHLNSECSHMLTTVAWLIIYDNSIFLNRAGKMGKTQYFWQKMYLWTNSSVLAASSWYCRLNTEGCKNCSKPCDEGFLVAFTDDLAFDADHPMAQCDSITSNWCRQQLWKTNMGIRALYEDKKFTEVATPYIYVVFIFQSVIFCATWCVCVALVGSYFFVV